MLLHVLIAVALADEGMWLPEQVPAIASELKEKGLALPPAALADPNGAVLGAMASLGYCSASFVSADGLLITNHHCVEGMLQYVSDAEPGRVREGYSATKRSDELWAGPGANLWVVAGLQDVTDAVDKAIAKKKLTDGERYDVVERVEKELVAACEKDGSRCDFVAFDGGRAYRLIRHVEIKDLRLVYVPPASVGNYGDDVDNWMWPRHAGDFAILRAYGSADGKPAKHDAKNVPWKPAHHLTIEPKGVGPGDFVMAAGWPGHTDRWKLSSELAFEVETSMPFELTLAEQMSAVLRAWIAKDAEAAAKLTAPLASIANGEKYTRGFLASIESADVQGRKVALEQELDAWINADPERVRVYGPALQELRTRIAARQQDASRDHVVGMLLGASDQLRVAHDAYRWAVEREKKRDLDRDPGFQDRDKQDRIDGYRRLEQTMYAPADADLLKVVFTRAGELPPDRRIPPLDAWVDEYGSVDAAVAALTGSTSVLTTESRLALLDKDRRRLERAEDPWMRFAVSLEGWLAKERVAKEAYRGAMLRLRPQYLSAMAAFRPGRFYSDANGTLRLTFGTVEGYSPRDAVVYLPQTTVAGMVEKAGPAPFDAPAALLAAAPDAPKSRWADPKLGDVPVDFTSTLDTTGGNSGSATLDGAGHLVGLLFDGNIEAVASDWVFLPEVNRGIHVDIRYVLWVLEVEGAAAVLDELGMKAKP